MWLLVAREPRPDAAYWPGRRWAALLDAAAWPLLWVLLAMHVPEPAGLLGSFVIALALIVGVRRVYRAAWMNHRYWFTTTRWGRVILTLLIVGAALKLAVTF